MKGKTGILVSAGAILVALAAFVAILATGNGRRDGSGVRERVAGASPVDSGDVPGPHEAERPGLPPDVRDGVCRTVDVGLAYAERNAALAGIDRDLNENEIAALEKCVMEEACCGRAGLHALKNDIMNVLRRRGGDPDGVVLFLCDGADAFFNRGDDVMVDYCIQHAAAALEGDLSSEARGLVMEMLKNATGYPDRTWSGTALLSLDRAPHATRRDKTLVEKRTLALLGESGLDPVRVSCIDIAKRNRWKSAVPLLRELQGRRDLSVAMKTAIAGGLLALQN